MEKGFTLVELIGVIILIAIISVIAYPTVTSSINKSKESALKSQINMIEEAAVKWGVENANELPDIGSEEKINVQLSTLIETGFVTVNEEEETNKIYNPMTRKEMTGCVVISYNNEYNQYVYEYKEPCED